MKPAQTVYTNEKGNMLLIKFFIYLLPPSNGHFISNFGEVNTYLFYFVVFKSAVYSKKYFIRKNGLFN